MSAQTQHQDNYTAASATLREVLTDIRRGDYLTDAKDEIAIAQMQATLAVADEMRALRQALTNGGAA